MQTERCPVCGWDVTMMPAFQTHLRMVRSDEAHVPAPYSLLGLAYPARRAEDRGWHACDGLSCRGGVDWRGFLQSQIRDQGAVYFCLELLKFRLFHVMSARCFSPALLEKLKAFLLFGCIG